MLWVYIKIIQILICIFISNNPLRLVIFSKKISKEKCFKELSSILEECKNIKKIIVILLY